MHVLSLDNRPILIIKQCFSLSGFQYLSTSFWCDLFTRPASLLCSVVNKMFALKGENNCKYKHGELHLELEQTCISDSSDSHLRCETDPQYHCPASHTLTCTVAHKHAHARTHTLIKDYAPRHSPQRGQAGKEVLGWAAVWSSRHISFPSSNLLVSEVS